MAHTKGKKTSKRIASIAARIARGDDFKISEARAVAASCVAQAEPDKPEDVAKQRCS